MKIKLYLLSTLIAFLAIGCTDDKATPLDNNQTPPGKVTDITVVNGHGEVTLTYTLPKDEDLLYVKSVYKLASGETREVKASYYTNKMLLDGFGDTNDHEVKVYAVNRSEVASEPVIITVKPLENAIWQIYNSMKILPDFAGMKLEADNPLKRTVRIEIYHKDSLGRWKVRPSINFESKKLNRNVIRGLDTIPQEFAVRIRDRFLNYTDTLYGNVIPIYEEELSKSLFREHTLPTDAKLTQPSIDLGGIPRIWDGDGSRGKVERLLTMDNEGDPQWITISLGQLSKLSRIKIWNFAEIIPNQKSLYYYRGQMRFFEIWGSENPNPDGSWDSSWFRLGSFENIKPSGLPYGQTSAEDDQVAEAGWDYIFDPTESKVKYLRFKSLKNWEGSTWFEILEISVFGDTRK